MKKVTGYRYLRTTRTEREPWSGEPKRVTAKGVQYYEQIEFSKPIKFGLIFSLIFLQVLLPLLISPWLLLTLPLFVWFMTKFIIGDMKSEKFLSHEVARNLKDEIDECCDVLKKLEVARDMSPEGSGIHARTEEYGRLLFKSMEQFSKLHDANAIMDGSHNSFYNEVREMKTILDNLKSSGNSLIEITATKRVDSVKRDLQFLGIDEFNEAISSETAIYRSLSTGSGDDS